MATSAKHCLIVGMGSGLSLAVAQRFAAEGFSIGAISRTSENLAPLLSALPPSTRSHAEEADASDEEALRKAIAACEDANGPAAVLVYNVGQMTYKPLVEVTSQEFLHGFAVNVGGALTCVKAVLPHMLAERSGTILLTGGGLALYPAPGLGTLSVGKAGIRNLALTLAREVKQHQVHVATVTICGMIQPGTFFAPDKIADVYWQLHREGPDEFREEVVYREAAPQ